MILWDREYDSVFFSDLNLAMGNISKCGSHILIRGSCLENTHTTKGREQHSTSHPLKNIKVIPTYI